MNRRDRLLQLIAGVYTAPGSFEGWHQFLLNLHTSFHGAGASFISHEFTSHTANVSVTAGFAPEDIRTYEAHWAAVDPWACSQAIRGLRSGSIAVGEQLVAHDALKRTAFFNEFGRHYDVVRCLIGMIEMEDRRTSVLSINRGENSPPFGSEEAALLRALMLHLQRALQIHRRLAGSDALVAGSITALDRLAHGVLLLDTAGRIMFANRMADEVLRAHDGLTVHGRELFGARAADTTALRTLIADAVSTSGGEGTGAGGLALIGRPSGRSPLRVLITPVTVRHVLMETPGTAACVFITDPERSAVPPAAHLQRVFGLTSAETRVASALLNGESVQRAADRLCISRNTARTHLRRLFAKTATTRQAELIRVLLGAHGSVRFD